MKKLKTLFSEIIVCLALVFSSPVYAQTNGSNAEKKPADSNEAPRTGSAEARFGLKFEPLDFKPPKVNHAALANKVTLDHYAEPEIPLVAVLARLRIGSVNDPEGKTGAASMTGEVIRNGGSANLKGDELDRELDKRGAQLSVESDREETWFRLSVLKEDLEWGTGVLIDLLTSPAFPQDKLDEARARSIVGIRQRLDVPMSVGRALFPQQVYGHGNPWGWVETEESMKKLTIDDLKKIYQHYYHAGNMKVGFAGDVTWETAQAKAEKTFGKLTAREIQAAMPEVEPIKASKVYIVPRDITQNVIYFGHEGINRFAPEKFAVKVFNNVLAGGFTSRLFKEIRSDRGLAYAVSGRISEGTKKGIYSNVALTKVVTTGTALDLMREINKDLATNQPTAQEVQLAKDSDINSFAFFFSTTEGVVRQKMTLDGFGYPADYLDTYVDKLKAVTPGEVSQAAAKNIHLDHIIVLVVGKVDAPLRQELEKIGPVTEISDEELRAKWL